MQAWRDLLRLPREVWILSAASLVNRVGTMVLPFLVLYLTEALEFKPGPAGLMLTLYGAGALVSAPLAGRLCDRFGALVVLEVSLVASGILLLFMPPIRSYGALAAAILAWSAVCEGFRPAVLSLLAQCTDPRHRKQAFALNRIAVNLGMSIGPLAGAFLIRHSFSLLFYVDAATSILAGVILVFFLRASALPEERSGSAGPEGGRRAAGAGSAWVDFRFLYFLAAIFPVAVAYQQLFATYPLFLVRDLAFPKEAFGLVFTLNTLMIIVIEVPLNAATAHWTHRKALVTGSLLLALGLPAVAFVSTQPALLATVVIWTFGEMIMFPAASACAGDMAPQKRRGEYMGLFSMNFSLGMIVGPWLGSAVYDRMGPAILWWGVLGLGLAAAAMGLGVRTAPPAEEAGGE